MAGGTKFQTSSIPREMQYGLDSAIQDNDYTYKGIGKELFTQVSTDGKAFYELIKLAGMTMAREKGEGESISFDTIDQVGSKTAYLLTYEKSCRVTREQELFNVYKSR